MILLLSNLIWIIYSCIDGIKDGFYWHFKNNTRKDVKFEIHPLFSAQRGIVLILMGGLLFNIFGYYSIAMVLSMMLIFSFFHNGCYYCTRHKLDENIYKLKWKDESTTSTAKMTKIMTYRNRTIFMILGILFQVFMYIFLMY